eukprot:6194666-Pleurochrysis_carterae.AAC.1
MEYASSYVAPNVAFGLRPRVRVLPATLGVFRERTRASPAQRSSYRLLAALAGPSKRGHALRFPRRAGVGALGSP